MTPLIDGDGTRFFEPLGVTGCATVVIDVDGRVRLRTTTTSPDAAEQVRRTFTALATNVPFLEDTTASVGERVQRLRACRPLLRCALDETTAWSTGAPGDVASVDACLLECDPGAAPRPVVLAAARAALADDDADRAVRLLEPWGSAPYPDVQRLLGDAYLKGNRLEQARFHLQRYLELAPQAGDAPEVRRELAP